jgi:hypothetical protein
MVLAAIIVGATAIALLLAAIFYIALQNRASQTIVLSTAAVLGALSVYIFNLYFELRGNSTVDHVTVEVTIDRLERQIGQWEYGATSNMRAMADSFARDWLVKNHPEAFDSDGAKLTKDSIVFSLLNFLVLVESDWQMSKVSYKGSGLQTWRGLSKLDECTFVTEETLRNFLSENGNIFAAASLQGLRRLCLPPKSVIEMSSDSIIVRTPIWQLKFQVDDPGMIHHAQPMKQEEGPLEMSGPTLPNGRSRFETRVQGISVEQKSFALRAHHPDKVKQQEWLARVLKDLHTWFEG